MCVNILSVELSEKQGWPYFLENSCSGSAGIVAIPCWEESKARCCSVGAAISQRKALRFCLLISGPISNDQLSWSRFSVAVSGVWSSKCLSQFSSVL